MQFAAFLTAVKTVINTEKNPQVSMHSARFWSFFPPSQFISEEVFNLISQVYANYLHEKYPKHTPFEYLVTKNYI